MTPIALNEYIVFYDFKTKQQVSYYEVDGSIRFKVSDDYKVDYVVIYKAGSFGLDYPEYWSDKILNFLYKVSHFMNDEDYAAWELHI